MSVTGSCEHCGAPLPRRAPAGLCPKCLLGQAVKAAVPLSPGGVPLTAPAEATREVFGDYLLMERIATGGMGVVYKARQLSLNRLVALKMVAPGYLASKESVERFHAEAEAAGSLQHPGIVGIHETGEWEGRHYFSMEYVGGKNLADVVHAAPLPPVRAAQVLKSIAEAVQYAHQHGILHRDLKPSNVIMDEAGAPHITDFGLAKRLEGDSELTLSGQVLGSPGFMPPEQAAGHQSQIDVRSDVYGLGAILYYLLTARAPFQAASVTEVLKQLADAEPVNPRLLNPSIPKDLATICLKCLEKHMPRRYATGQAVADELGRFLEERPIQARPVGAPGRVLKWVRRRPALAGMTASLVICVGVGLAVILHEWREAVRQRRSSERNELLARQNAYAADMQVVQTALARGDLGEALACLDRQRPAPGQKDLRNWEWRYFWRLCRSDEEFLLHRYSESVAALEFSSDGKWLVVRRERGAVALWEAETRKAIVELPGGGQPHALALSPQGEVLAYGNVASDGSRVISLWNLRTQQEKRLSDAGNSAYLAFSPDGGLLASSADDGMARLWQTSSGRIIAQARISLPEPAPGGRIRFSPSGELLAIGQSEVVVLWAWASDQQRKIPAPKTWTAVSALAFSPDGKLLAAGGTVIYLWDVSKVWGTANDSDALTPIRSAPAPRSIIDLAFAPSGTMLATAAADLKVRLWDVKTLQEIRSYQGNTHAVWAVGFSPDGKHLVSGGRDGSVRYWDPAAKAAESPSAVLPMPVWNAAFAFSPDGRQFVALDYQGSASLWETRTLRRLKDLAFLGTSNWTIKWAPDRGMLAVGDRAGNLRLWDMPHERLITNFANPGAHIGMVRFAGRGRSVFCGIVPDTPGRPRSARLWHVADWREILLPLNELHEPQWGALSPDNRTFAALDGDGTVAWWDLETGSRLARFPHHFASIGGYLAFSPDGRMLAGSATEGLTTLWDVATGRFETVRGNLRAVYGVAFCTDGQRLISGGRDGSDVVRLLDVASKRYVASLPGEPDEYWYLALSPDESTLVAAGMRGTTLLWRAPSWAEIEAAEKRMPVP